MAAARTVISTVPPPPETTGSEMSSPQEKSSSRDALRARNLRTGLILLTVVAVFFIGVMIKTKLMGM
ncbi:hypothetical protein GCM10027419_35080 [Pandoraea terrae]